MSFKDKFLKKSPLASHGGPHVGPTDNYKKYLKQQEQRKAEIESLKNVISSQKEKQTSYDKQMKDYQSMIKKIKDFSSSPTNTIYYDFTSADQDYLAKKPKYDFSKDVETGKINQPFDSNSTSYPTYTYFKDKDKKQIAISWGDLASTERDIFATDYYAKPEGKRPKVNSETSNILQEKLKAFEEQEEAGYTEKPTQSVIKEQPVYTGPVYDHSTGKVKRYITTAQYRTQE
tara:strand:+ start:58 stop:750 length:693 start_codon:yes stop_codon:yes gene_type:complete